ncbi:MAG: hypothetical protein JO163_14465 [Methylobacteriaceae bacterium]|nr:hypothetical protein [Methylobacteriaceae bacterium]MBV9703930.1 hypothetical protein [Methylobacteriaceae bacterium]
MNLSGRLTAAATGLLLGILASGENLTGAAPAFAVEGVAVVDNIEIDAGPAKIRIPHVEAAGTTLSDAELAELLDPNSPTSLTDRLDKLTVASIIVPEVLIEVPAGKITWKNLNLTDVTRGKIRVLTLKGGSLSMTGPNSPPSIEGTFGFLRARVLDLGLYARIGTQSRQDTKAALETLLDGLTFEGMHLKAGDVLNISLGKVSMSGLKGRPLLASFADLQRALSAGSDGKSSQEQAKTFVDFLSDLTDSFAIGSIEFHDAVTQGSNSGKSGAFKVGRFSLSGLAGGRLDELAIDGFSVEADSGYGKVGTFLIKGLNFKPILDVLLTAVGRGGPMPVPAAMGQTIDRFVVGGIDAEVPDATGEGNAANGARNKFSLARVELDWSNYVGGMPGLFTAAVDHLVADVPAKSTSSEIKSLIEMGYPKLDLSAKMDLAWNEAAKELRLKELSLTGADMGTVAIAGLLGNVTRDAFVGEPAAMRSADLAVLAKRAEVRIENSGLFEKVMSFAAKTTQQSPDEARQYFAKSVSRTIAERLGNGAGARSIADAVGKFIAEPKSLRISASSAQGLGAADFKLLDDPKALLDKLDIAASADE